MTRRRRRPAPPRLDDAWTRTQHYTANGRRIEPGTELKISGEPGRFRFREHVVTLSGAEWVDVIGGTKGCAQWRSFRPDRIRRVHRKRQTITGAEAKALLREKRAERASVTGAT